MNYHPLANLFPLLEGREFDELCEDIRQHGQREPIWVLDDTILDGRNRYRACERLGVEPYVEDYEGDNAVAFVLSLNLHRRHLNESQRAMVAAKLATMGQGKPANLPDMPPTQAAAAELLNVSERSVRSARAVLDDAPAEIVAAVERGVMAASLAAKLSELTQDVLEQVALAPVEQMAEIARAVTKAHVANNSGNNEWYTPAEYIEAARAVMGSIDTDPASCELANKTVRAGVYFSAEDNGLAKNWAGNVWMNPPYAQPLISEFCEALASKYENREIEQACVLVNNATETAWFQRLLKASTAVCFPKGRIRFIDKDGNPTGAPLQGQAVLYFGSRVREFAERFAANGVVLGNV